MQDMEHQSATQEGGTCDHEEGLLERPEAPTPRDERRLSRRVIGVFGAVMLCGTVAAVLWLGQDPLISMVPEDALQEYEEQCPECGHKCDCTWVATRGACLSPPRGGSCCWTCCCHGAGHESDPGFDRIPHGDWYHGSYHGARPQPQACKYKVDQHVYVRGHSMTWHFAIVRHVLPGCHYSVLVTDPGDHHDIHIYHTAVVHHHRGRNSWWIVFLAVVALLALVLFCLARNPYKV
mmetsp:Transcript_31316/g.91322  ORF Transcript_31316/g.91322 Transcript_31316/m.91322 type:complete len:235 (-) Transcript_31316:59-763(-)